jgi:hypothetical protein
MPVRLDKPLRLMCAAQDGKGAIGGGPALQSLLEKSHDITRSARGGEAMPVEMMGVL